MDASVLPLLDNISRMAEAGTATPTPTSLPVMTNTPLDSVSLALSQMQLVMAKRMTHMQRLAAEVVGGVTHSEKPLPEVSKAVRESLRIAGVLIATADATVGAAQRQLATLEGARRALAAVLPGEVTRMPAEEAGRREAAAGLDALSPADLRGLGHDLGIGSPGYTEQYEALWSQDAAGGSAGIAPLTVPIRALSPDEGDPPTGAAGVFAAGELPAELVDAWICCSRWTWSAGRWSARWFSSGARWVCSRDCCARRMPVSPGLMGRWWRCGRTRSNCNTWRGRACPCRE